MKSVLISIQPRWCEMIAAGRKTVEVRKTVPKLELPFKCYIYCTNKKPFLVWGDVFRGNWETEVTHLSGWSREAAEKIWDILNGKVIGEFVCNFVDIYEFDWCDHPELGISGDGGDNWYCIDDEDLKKTCIPEYEFYAYGNREDLYGWHISDLVIYDDPKPLSDFHHCGVNYHFNPPITRPPQSWCYVEEE